MTIEVHSTIKEAKATGNKFRSYFATAVDGEDLEAPMSVIFTAASGGKPRAAHAILTIDPLVTSSYGRDKYTGKTAIFVSDKYTEKEIEAKAPASRPLCKPSEWTEGTQIPIVPAKTEAKKAGARKTAPAEETVVEKVDGDLPF